MVTFQLAIRFEKFIFINFDGDATLFIFAARKSMTSVSEAQNCHFNPFAILNGISESTVKEIFDFERSLKVIFEFQELFLLQA